MQEGRGGQIGVKVEMIPGEECFGDEEVIRAFPEKLSRIAG